MNTINQKTIPISIFKLVLPLFVLLLVQSAANAQALPPGFSPCAKEGEQCQFTGTKEVRYGADTRWKIMTATNGIKCDYVTFGGDPAYGTHKQCYIQTTTSENLPNYQKYVSAEPSQTELIPTSGMKTLMGADPSPVSSMLPTYNNEAGLPFTVDDNYPAFYVIPANQRPKIMNQGGCGSCVAWSTTTALASVLAREGKYSTFNVYQNMPDAMKFFTMGDRSCDKGWNIPDSVKRMTNTGTFLSVVQPTNKNQIFASFFEELLKTSSASKPINNWWVRAGKGGYLMNKDAMRKFIYTKGALVADFAVMNAFNRYQSGIYNQTEFVGKLTKDMSGQQRQTLADDLNTISGYHAVTVIGYFKGGKISLKDYMKPIMPDMTFPDIEMTLPAFWVIQNSWSDKWGMNGLIYMAADQNFNGYEQDKTTKRLNLIKADQIDDVMYYMLDPTITSASDGRDVRTAAPSQRAITFRNEAGYVAKMMVSYFEPDAAPGAILKNLFSDNIPVGQTVTLDLPPTKPNTQIIVNLIGTATTKDNFYSGTVESGFTGNQCFKAWGTLFSPQGGSCSEVAGGGANAGNTGAGTRVITFRNEAGYVAKMMISYFEAGPGGVPLPKFLFTDNIPVGQSKSVEVPSVAPNTQVTVNLIGTGTTKDNFFSAQLDGGFSGNHCYKAWGTLFSPQGGNCQ